MSTPSRGEVEIPLVGGRGSTGVVRVGDTVRRSAGPWTPTVQAFLAHLRARGFTGAPRPLGFDTRGREVVEYIEGDVLAVPQDPAEPLVLGRWPDPWRTDDALAAAGELLRGLHDASAGFRTDSTAWRLHDGAMRPGEIVCHGDAGPWNAVYRGGRPVALIDFDSARPHRPLLDLAAAAWNFVPLADERTARILGFEELHHGPRLATFVRAYGLEDAGGLLDALQHVKEREASYPRFWGIRPERAADFIEGVAGQLRWLAEVAPALERALGEAR